MLDGPGAKRPDQSLFSLARISAVAFEARALAFPFGGFQLIAIVLALRHWAIWVAFGVTWTSGVPNGSVHLPESGRRGQRHGDSALSSLSRPASSSTHLLSSSRWGKLWAARRSPQRQERALSSGEIGAERANETSCAMILVNGRRRSCGPGEPRRVFNEWRESQGTERSAHKRKKRSTSGAWLEALD